MVIMRSFPCKKKVYFDCLRILYHEIGSFSLDGYGFLRADGMFHRKKGKNRKFANL